MEISRATSATKTNVEMYFVDQPHLIFNIGEKGITVDHLASRAVAGSEIHRRM